MNNDNQHQVFTIIRATEGDYSKRSERLQNGIRINDLWVFFHRGTLTIQIRETQLGWHEVDLGRCCNRDELMDWIFDLSKRSCEPGMVQAFLTLLDDLCLLFFQETADIAYIAGNQLDWSSKTITRKLGRKQKRSLLKAAKDENP
jgi:hypothetical protein